MISGVSYNSFTALLLRIKGGECQEQKASSCFTIRPIWNKLTPQAVHKTSWQVVTLKSSERNRMVRQRMG